MSVVKSFYKTNTQYVMGTVLSLICIILKNDLPLLLLSLQLQVDPAHQVGLGVQDDPDLPLVQSHLLVPTIEKKHKNKIIYTTTLKPSYRGGVKKRNYSIKEHCEQNQQFNKKKDVTISPSITNHGMEKLSICCVGGLLVIKATYSYVIINVLSWH